MAAPSQVGIANRALQLLGAQRLESLTQDHPNAREINIAFDPTRQDLLREYTWNFSIKRQSIAADPDETTFGGLNRFRKPNDFLRLLRQTSSIQGDSRRPDWQIEGEFIVTADGSPLDIRYVADVENPVLMDPSFREVFAARLAANIVEAVAGSGEIHERVAIAEERGMLRARHSNAIENDGDVPLEDDWLLERL